MSLSLLPSMLRSSAACLRTASTTAATTACAPFIAQRSLHLSPASHASPHKESQIKSTVKQSKIVKSILGKQSQLRLQTFAERQTTQQQVVATENAKRASTTTASTGSISTQAESSAAAASQPRHILSMLDLSADEIRHLLYVASVVKSHPHEFTHTLAHHTLVMLFSKPSLRTRLSFETGMTQLGGHAIYYPLDGNSTLGGGKEALSDVASVLGRYANLVMARLPKRQTMRELAQHCPVPVINALDDWAHPCQVLADLLTMAECRAADAAAAAAGKKHLTIAAATQESIASLSGLKVAYCGDLANNVTYDLMRGCLKLGMHVSLAGPDPLAEGGAQFAIDPAVIDECSAITQQSLGSLSVHSSALESVKDADFVLTDTWSSYHLSKDPQVVEARLRALHPFQVSAQLMSLAKPNARFLHCLPAKREAEVTSEVIDGPQSVIFEEAENRMHAQKALMLFLLNALAPIKPTKAHKTKAV